MTTSLQNLWCFRTVSVPDSMFQNVCSTLSTHHVLSRESKKIITNNSKPISQGEAQSQNNISVSYSWGAWAKFRTQARVTPATLLFTYCSSQYRTASHRAPEIERESPVWLIVFLTTKSSEKSLAWKLGRVTTHQAFSTTTEFLLCHPLGNLRALEHMQSHRIEYIRDTRQGGNGVGVPWFSISLNIELMVLKPRDIC